MERGSSKHGPRQDEALAEDLAGQLGPGGSNREEWADPEPPADDDPPARTDLPAGETGTGGDRDGELAAYTDRTITDRGELERQIHDVHQQGWAEAVGEREPDLNAVAAPVLGRAGELVAILGLQGPAARLPAARRRTIRAPLLAAAAELSRAVGGPAGPRDLR